jgi:hypothetical protein
VDRAILNSADRAILNSADRAILNSADRAILNSADRAILNSADRAILNTVFENTFWCVNVWRLAGDTLNITCNFMYRKHQEHRDLLITLYK